MGLDGLCWGMGDWDLGLEGGAWAWLGGFWILAGCWVPATKKLTTSTTTKKINKRKKTHTQTRKKTHQTNRQTDNTQKLLR